MGCDRMERRRHGPAAGLKLGYAASAQIVSERLPGLMPGRRRRPTRQPWGAGRENLPAGSAAYSTSFRIFCTESSCSRS